MLKISTSGVCPKCVKEHLWYEDGKFVCKECGRKYTSKDITMTMSDMFEITTRITEKDFRDKMKALQNLTDRFNADLLGYDPITVFKERVGLLDIGWEHGYPVRLNMMVQELNEILN
jgi:hypothetical protein